MLVPIHGRVGNVSAPKLSRSTAVVTMRRAEADYMDSVLALMEEPGRPFVVYRPARVEP